MNHTILIAAAILLCITALVAALILVTKSQQRKRKAQLRLDLNLLLGRHDLQAAQLQEFEHRIIALDPARTTVAFIQDDITKPTLVVDLSQVDDLRLWKEGRNAGLTETTAGLRPDEQVTVLGLSFGLKNGEREFMPFYSEILDGIGARTALLQDAEQWLRRLQPLTQARDRQAMAALSS